MQVKYEMLRRVSVEKASVTDASDTYGVSRPTYYQAKADFEQAGIAGLVPKKRGPRGSHKIQSEILAFFERGSFRASRSGHANWRNWSSKSSALLCIQGRSSAPSVEKKHRDDARRGREAVGHGLYPRCQYETLRMAMRGEALPPEARSGLMLFLRRGMSGWARRLAVGGSVRQEPQPAPRSDPVEPAERSSIVYAFAAIAIKVNTRRTP